MVNYNVIDRKTIKIESHRHKPFSRKLKNTVIALAFLVLFILLDNAVGGVLYFYNYFYNPDSDSLMWKDFYNTPADSIDVLFVGSSHAKFAFNTKKFNDSLNIQTFDLASPDQTPKVGYYALKESLKYQKPKLIVYDAYWREFGIHDDTTPAYFVYDYIKGFDTKIELLASLHRDDNFVPFLLEALSRTYKYRNSFFPKVVHHNDIKNRETGSDGIIYAADGYFSSSKVADYNALYKSNSFKDVSFDWDDEQINYFNKTMELCMQNNIKVLIVTAPLPKPSIDFTKNYDNYSKTMKKMSGAFGLEYIDYNMINKNTGIFGNEMFYDSNHLNKNGAEILDTYLVREIKNYLIK